MANVQYVSAAPQLIQGNPSQLVVADPNAYPQTVVQQQIGQPQLIPQQFGQQQLIQQQVGQPQVVQQIGPGGQQILLEQAAPGAPQPAVIQQVVQGGGAVPGVKHIPLAKCRCLYLGSAVPLETAVGLDALQQPLRERYNTTTGEVPGIDAWVTTYSSGLRIQYIDKNSNEQPSVWFPIQTLHVCAAVKAIDLILENQERQTKFIALDSENGRKSKNPPMFAAIMRRTAGRKILECHVFVVKCNEAAMALVKSATHAYEHKEGWTDDEPEFEDDDCGDPMRLLAAEPPAEKQAPPEFYKQTPQQGYFYTPNKDLVRNYNIHGAGGAGGGPYPPQGPPPPHALPAPYPAYPDPGYPDPGYPELGYDPYYYGNPYFDDWGAFSGPVSVFGQPPPEFYGPPVQQPKKPKKKKKKSRKSHECCDCEDDWEDDCCCQDDHRNDHYPDHHYREYRERRRDDYDDRPRRDDRRIVEYVEREPVRERVYIEREPPRRERERVYVEPHRRRDDCVVYAPHDDCGDEFYDPYGTEDLVRAFRRPIFH